MSPLHNLIDQIQREPGNPIPYAEEPRWTPPPARIIVSDGQWTDQATAGDRARLADRLAPVDDVPQSRPKVWAYAMRQPVRRDARFDKPRSGRPCVHSADMVPEITRMRAEGRTWRQIGEALGIPAQAARGKVQARKKAEKAMAAVA